MKRVYLALLLCFLFSGVALGQTTYTPNLHLALPEAIPGSWGADYNNNFVILDGSSTTALKCANGQIQIWSGSGWTCGNFTTGTFGADVAFSGDLTPPQITANQDNYNPTGLSTASTLRLSTDASRNITGVAGGIDGRLLLIHNVGSFPLILKNLTTSTAANQFAINADITLNGNQGLILQYDSTSQKWRAASGISGGGGGQAADNDLTAIAGLSGTGFPVRTGTDTWAQRSITGQASNIVVTNGDGVAGNPTVDVGPNVALTSRNFTPSAFDYDFGGANSLGIPRATGAAPTTSSRMAYDLTSNTYKGGFTGTTKTFATTDLTQPLNTNLTQFSTLSPAANQAIIFRGGTWTVYTRPNCNAANQASNYDQSTGIEGCTTFSAGLSSGTAGKYLIANGATGFETTAGLLSNSGTNVHVSGGLEVNCTTGTDCVTLDTSGYVGHVPYSITVPYVGASASVGMTVGAKTSGNVVKFDANGAMIAGGLAGSGDVTLAGPNTLTNTTMDEASGNVFKVTKSVQVELFGPTTDTTSGNGQYYFRVPVSLNGTNLVGIQSNTVTAGTTGLTSVQITRCAAVATSPLCSGTTASMLSTVVSIDSGETSSSTAATAAVINTANDDVSTGQILRFDVTAIHTTPAKGLIVNLDFKLP